MGATITASSPMFKRGNNLYLAVNLYILSMLKQREPCPKYESYFRVQSVDPDFEQRHQNVSKKAKGKRCNVQKKGGNTKLTIKVHLREECYFVVTSKDNSNMCCYDGPNNYCRKSPMYKRGNNSKCLKWDEYFLRMGPTTCELLIESNSEAASGLYKSYNADDEKIQECDIDLSHNVTEPKKVCKYFI